jgi:ketosteroid isomerase-like protein
LRRESSSAEFNLRKPGDNFMNSKRAAFVIALVLSLAALLGLAWAANVEDELKKLESDRAAAVVKGDVATLEKQTSDDYTLINVNGQMSGKAQMVDAFKSGQTKLTTDELSDIKVRVYGNTAVLTGKATVKGTVAGKDVDGQVLFTRVYVKKGGSWQSVAFQQTRVGSE